MLQFLLFLNMDKKIHVHVQFKNQSWNRSQEYFLKWSLLFKQQQPWDSQLQLSKLFWVGLDPRDHVCSYESDQAAERAAKAAADGPRLPRSIPVEWNDDRTCPRTQHAHHARPLHTQVQLIPATARKSTDYGSWKTYCPLRIYDNGIMQTWIEWISESIQKYRFRKRDNTEGTWSWTADRKTRTFRRVT